MKTVAALTLSLLALVGSVDAYAVRPIATASPTVDADSNAGRLAQGLAPLKPKALWNGQKTRRQTTPSGSPSATEQGYLYAVQADQSVAGCVISDGTWFVGGTCATYNRVVTGDQATLSTSKGPCMVTTSGTLSCASGNTATAFTVSSDGTLSLDGATSFSADQVPATSTRQTIYHDASHAVLLTLDFVAKGTSQPSSSAPSAGSSASSTSSSAAYPSGTGLTVCSAQDVSSFALSCSSASVQDTCCTDSPGGHILLTQFWDTGSQSTGPNNSWTLHGLWPDNCDGTYEQYCDPSRETSNVRGTLEANAQTDLLAYMDVYWKDYQGDDESFWEHEYNKHGTCISSLEPKCFNNYQPQQDLVVYFNRAVDLYKGLPSFDWLAAAGIVPSLTATYTRAQIEAALSAHFGGGININCDGNTFNELWYHYRTQGGVASGNFVPSPAVGSGSTCPSTGIRLLPKYVDVTTPTTPPSDPAPSSAPSGGTAPAAGVRGFVYPTYPDGTVESASCMISDGTWYKGGSCAGYTLVGTSVSGAYNLQTSKGLCGVDAASSALTCASTVAAGSAATFTIDAAGTLSLGGTTGFSADALPSGSTRQKVYSDASHPIDFVLRFVGQ